MAKIISIDILKCVSGKFGGGKSKKILRYEQAHT